MPATPVSVVQSQVAKVSRRLFAQLLLDNFVWCWAAALLCSAVWFLAQPWLLGTLDEWVRWAIAGGVFVVSTAIGIGLSSRRAPSPVAAALELDQRFNLKERVTSSLTLAPELTHSSAGQALLADAGEHVAKVDVRQRFPVRLSWTAALVPACAVVLAVVALFYNPVFTTPEAEAAKAKEALKVVNAKEIEQKFNNLKKPTTIAWAKDQPKSEQLEEIEKLREKLFLQPLDPNDKDKVRERLQQLLPLEDKIKDRLDDLKAQQERNKAMADKLKEMGDKNQLGQEGPAKGLEAALNKGDLDKAQKEMQAIADKLKNDKLNDEERKQLQDQLQEIKDKLDNVAEQKDLKDQLKKDLDEGKITKEEFEKKMGQADEQADKLKDLKELAKKVEATKDELAKGDCKCAGDKLGDAAKELQKLDPNGQEMQQLQQNQQNLQEAKNAMQQGLGQPNTPPGGERPVAKDGKTGTKDEKQKGDLDTNTQFRESGQQKGGTFSKIPATQVGGVFRQAQQDAPEAIERQQVPPDAAEFLRGYYENLGGSKK
jgi:hypothetical protein